MKDHASTLDECLWMLEIVEGSIQRLQEENSKGRLLKSDRSWFSLFSSQERLSKALGALGKIIGQHKLTDGSGPRFLVSLGGINEPLP